LFAESIDNFVGTLLTHTQGAVAPELQALLDRIQAAKVEVLDLHRREQAEALAERQARAQRTAAEANAEPRAPVPPPPPRVIDGIALGHQLMTELGLAPVHTPTPRELAAVMPPPPVSKPPAAKKPVDIMQTEQIRQMMRAMQPKSNKPASNDDFGTLQID
jgi:hypothetical protein